MAHDARNTDPPGSHAGAEGDKSSKIREFLLVHTNTFGSPGYNGYTNVEIGPLCSQQDSSWHRHGDTFRGHHPPEDPRIGPHWTRPRYECPRCHVLVEGEVDPLDAHMVKPNGHMRNSRLIRPLLPLQPVNRPIDVNPCPTPGCEHNFTSKDMIHRLSEISGKPQRVLWLDWAGKGLRAGWIWRANPLLSADEVWRLSEEEPPEEEPPSSGLRTPPPSPKPDQPTWRRADGKIDNAVLREHIENLRRRPS